MNLPNKVTLVRIFLVPLITGFLISPSPVSSFIAACIFSLASFTDWLDGHLARQREETTLLGKLLDPIADKLLITSALIPLVALDRAPAWMVVIIIGREFAVTGLRAVIAAKSVIIAASPLGKYKMISEIVAVLFLILDWKTSLIDLNALGFLALWVAMILGLTSAIDYFTKFLSHVDLDLE
ncbi:MAG: CDP-diacylglycerol--glycerol-3-phosphate 3-phosphatidyltransferase [Candidatus Tectomicrobia bacterium]|nr:CDP-diacylglycerol--glycerol-3-phosphate 3-phosphatidyltransferase [Candidatus Tectomicrobia bacterium]